MLLRSVAQIASIAFVLLGAEMALSGDRQLNSFRVILNPNNQAKAIDRSFLADVYLKKITQWPDGSLVRPVDLQADSAVRIRFSQDVLSRSVAAVKSYWQQVIFSGRNVPPPELENDDEVIKYVLKHEGAIGYISNTANVGAAKVVSVQ